MEYIASIMPQLLSGLRITLLLFAVTLVLSLPLGLLVALANASVQAAPTDNFIVKWLIKFPVRMIIKLYLTVFRGTPLMLQLFFFYFGLAVIVLPNGNRLAMDAMTAATIAFALNYSAYFAEIFRGGIIGVDKGQYEASKALGLNGFQVMRYIVVPQMLRIVIPPIANETIVLVKDTALASSITLIDLLKRSQEAVNRDMNTTPLLVAGVFYLLITLVIAFIFGRIEKRLSIEKQNMV